MNPYRTPYGDPDAAADEFWGREWTDDDEAELQARWESDPVCVRLEKELDARREQIRQRYLEDVSDGM